MHFKFADVYYCTQSIISKCSENNSCKSRLRENDFNVVMNYIPKAECYIRGHFHIEVQNYGILHLSDLTDLKSSKSKAILKRKLSSGKHIVD